MPSHSAHSIFYPRDVVSAAYATATWLGGWLSVTAGIVSKRLNLSYNFFDHMIAPSFKLLWPFRRYQVPRGTPSSGR